MKILISLGGSVSHISDRDVLARIQTFLRNQNWKFPIRLFNLANTKDMYPVIGAFSNGMKEWYFSAQKIADKKYQLHISPEVTFSNELYRLRKDLNSSSVKQAEEKTTELAKSLKTNGMKVTIVPNGSGMNVEVLAVFDFDPTDDKHIPKYGIKVTGKHGNSSVFKTTPNSQGPWTLEEAKLHVRDLAEHLSYDDDYKHPTFTIVPVKSK